MEVVRAVALRGAALILAARSTFVRHARSARQVVAQFLRANLTIHARGANATFVRHVSKRKP